MPESKAEVMFKSAVQLADNRLLLMEQFPLGGMATVRGYRENYLVKDNGALASLELRLPVYDYNNGDGAVYLVPFLDSGWGWNKGGSGHVKNIASAGGGVPGPHNRQRLFPRGP
ncbi:MAG: BamA/TamA family outer membrane protein [Deltaproteobacteria bacterium]|nr:BamA/TamA family outer membrane protein [Deltaproteobacteria bacterium]